MRSSGHGKDAALTRPHDVYLALGHSDLERRRAYREPFRRETDPDDLQSLRTAINLCVPVGNDRFKAQPPSQAADQLPAPGTAEKGAAASGRHA